MTTVPLVDLSDHASFRDGFPHEFFTWLRDNAPVWWHEPTPVTPDGEGFWVVSRYDDVMAVLRDPDTYSSERGGARERGGTAIKDERQIGELLNLTDDPKHRRLRSLVNSGFTPRAIEALATDIRVRVGDLLDRCPVGEPYEFVSNPIAIDLLFGSDRERLAIEAGIDCREVAAAWEPEERAFTERRAAALLYG